MRVDDETVAEASDSENDRIDPDYRLTDFRHGLVGHAEKQRRSKLLNFGLAL